jgi:hypothetical protein
MSRQDHPQTRPSFDAPSEIVTGRSLSKKEKAEALEDPEQDARQLAIAVIYRYFSQIFAPQWSIPSAPPAQNSELNHQRYHRLR